MRRNLRILGIGGIWITGGLAAALGPTCLHAQEVVDLPAEDSPLSPDFEPVYRIGSAQAAAEWEEFVAVRSIGFDGAGNLYLLDGTGTDGGRRVAVVDASGRHVRDFGRVGGGPGEFQMAGQLMVWADGRSLVSDRMRGYHVFNPDGQYEHTARESGGFMVMTAHRPPTGADGISDCAGTGRTLDPPDGPVFGRGWGWSARGGLGPARANRASSSL